ncbi:hypothetical protein [Streptomyces galbus]|uniref:hypothetical protein n=1 Tax=Streptomyces galbus TaxID=33898 RepID=UPI0019AEC79A|nr:hypothetical protein GCM10010335_61510 [Streptomyces galbus]
MRERTDVVDTSSSGGEGTEGTGPGPGEPVPVRRIDLSVPQVAGSAVAAVIAAKLASYFGVYGTILGAGVVSIVATCGGTVFQHFFKRTGEQLREATVARPRETPARTSRGAPGRSGAPRAPGEYSQGTVYRARTRSWKRPVVAAALVFGVTMAGITAYELASGNSFSGGRGTTVSDAVTGGTSRSGSGGGPSPAPPATAPATGGGPAPSSGASSGAPADDGGAATDSGTPSGATPTPTPTPDATGSTGATSQTPAPGSSDAATTAPTDPAPSAGSRSGTAGPGPAGPAAP